MKKAIIFDLDGVLVDSSKRFKKLNLKAFDEQNEVEWIKSVKLYNQNCDEDEVIDLGIDLLEMLCSFYKPDAVFFITARGDGGYKPTLRWLKEEGIWREDCILIMQPEDFDNYHFYDQKDHANYKKKVADRILKNYDIIVAVDDSEDNVQAYRDLKIPTLKFCVPIGRVLV